MLDFLKKFYIKNNFSKDVIKSAEVSENAEQLSAVEIIDDSDKYQLNRRIVRGTVLFRLSDCSSCPYLKAGFCHLYQERLKFMWCFVALGGPVIDEYERCAACQGDILPSEYKAMAKPII